jgi:hypothetical protein
MPLFKVAFSVWIDEESYPQVVDKKTGIEVAKILTTNPIGEFEWDGGLFFKEYLFADVEEEADLEFEDLQPQCPEAEFSYASKVRKKEGK